MGKKGQHSSRLRRAEIGNARDDLLHWVTEVRVFGSYLTDSDDLGDLDLAINLERRPVEKTGE
jgi:predicted nucleotidyltransferase